MKFFNQTQLSSLCVKLIPTSRFVLTSRFYIDYADGLIYYSSPVHRGLESESNRLSNELTSKVDREILNSMRDYVENSFKPVKLLVTRRVYPRNIGYDLSNMYSRKK